MHSLELCDEGSISFYSDMDIQQRFLSKINKTDSCWLWTASVRGNSGYGAFRINGKIKNAHRVAYNLFIGKIPVGLDTCHKCDNRLCVNPEHLFLGNRKDNMQDASRKGRLISIQKIKYPEGKKWCWMCKKFKDIKLFPPSAKIYRRKECTRCNTKDRRRYKR